MSLFDTRIVVKPPYFRVKPTRMGWGKRPPYVIGFDTEAYKGRPFLMQFSLPDTSPSEADLVWCKPGDILESFIEYVDAVSREHIDRRVIVFGWNLRYEWTQLFRNLPTDAFEQSTIVVHGHDEGECGRDPKDGWNVSMEAVNEKRYFAKVQFDSGRGTSHKYRTVQVVDGMAFYSTSLDKAASIIGIDGKEVLPEDTKGNLSPRKALHDMAFQSYAKRDAWITRRLGETIIDYHLRYDIPPTLTAPMFAASVYRKAFLNDEIPLCDDELEHAGLRSYHGGKNGFYLGRPSSFDDAYDYDLNAAYTGAMSQLPDPVEAVWEETFKYEPDVDGLWYVTADAQSCTYRFAQEDSGRWLTWKDNGIQSFWITSYELDAAIRLGEIAEVYACSGFVMRGDRGTGSLRAYCDTFSDLKKNAPDSATRTMAKLCLNSLYGKFIQKVPTDTSLGRTPIFDVLDTVDGPLIVPGDLTDGGWKAGGLYHPAIASLITGMVRARVHLYEHKYAALMTSTDGFLSLVPPDPDDIGGNVGQLKVKRGRLTLWRERLYVFDPPGTHDPCGERGCEDHPVYALHGFRAGLSVLRQVPVAPGIFDYSGRQVIGLRESLRKWDGRRYEPGTFVNLPYQLALGEGSDRSPLPPRTDA